MSQESRSCSQAEQPPRFDIATPELAGDWRWLNELRERAERELAESFVEPSLAQQAGGGSKVYNHLD